MKARLFLRLNLIIILLLSLGSVYSYGINLSEQINLDNKIEGHVTNKEDKALVGVSVSVKGTSRGTVTDEDGNFRLNDVSENDTLVFSYIGYLTRRVPIKGRSSIKIELQMSSQSLNQLVVVGYGSQKKANLTGSVDQVSGKILENRPMPNVERGLQGVIPNLYIKMVDGKPSRASTLEVRGAGSIGAGGSALVLIDGVPGNPTYMNPNDIASVTVLKDAAAAAVYGARGAFGVILITTKKPKKGKLKLEYNSNFSLNYRTIKPKLLTNGYLWTENFVKAYEGWFDGRFPSKINNLVPFSQDYFNEIKRRNEDPSLSKIDIDPASGNYRYYGNTDWQKLLYTNYNPSTEQNLSISGGGDKVNYYISGRYYSQKGIFRYNPDPYKTYNLRAKGSVQIFPWLNVSNNISFHKRNYHWPIVSFHDYSSVYRRLSDQFYPISMLRNPDGTLSLNSAVSLGSFVSGNNYEDQQWIGTYNTTSFEAGFLQNKLVIKGDLSFKHQTYLKTRVNTYVPYSIKPGQVLERGVSRINQKNNNTNYLGANIYASYQQNFGRHHLKGMIGYDYENSKTRLHYYGRDNLINPNQPDFSLANGNDLTITGGGSGWAILGSFFRFNYNYNDKYLIEVNGRYDGSSKFPSHSQFGFFPSASVGWRISEEPFWKVSKDFISNLKLRASFGSLGNGNINPYQFIETLSVYQVGDVINGTKPNATKNPSPIPRNLTWEKASTANVGINAGFLKSRLNLTFDAYHRYTTGMYTVGQPLPAVFGAGVPKGNFANLRTQGFELTLNWQDKFNLASKPFNYSVKFVFSDNTTFITKYNNPKGLINTYYKGMRQWDIWGFVNNGYFKDNADIMNAPDQSFIQNSEGNIILPGDIKFKDINNDGKIDRGNMTLTDHGDYKIIGNSHARYPFGLNANADWNNFSLSFFFQGIGKRQYWFGKDASFFWGQYNRPYGIEPIAVYNNQWSPNNPNAYFPRLRGYAAIAGAGGSLTYPQSKYIQNVAYIRLKNLTIGYNLPKSIISKIGMSSARIYMTGQNIWTWSPMYKLMKTFDPEVIEHSDIDATPNNQGNGFNYPMLKTYTVGINIIF